MSLLLFFCLKELSFQGLNWPSPVEVGLNPLRSHEGGAPSPGEAALFPTPYPESPPSPLPKLKE